MGEDDRIVFRLTDVSWEHVVIQEPDSPDYVHLMRRHGESDYMMSSSGKLKRVMANLSQIVINVELGFIVDWNNAVENNENPETVFPFPPPKFPEIQKQ